MNTTWKINIKGIVDQSNNTSRNLVNAEWEQLNCKGEVPEPMSHHSTFIFENKIYCYGGLIGSQGSKSNGDFWILDLDTNKWS